MATIFILLYVYSLTLHYVSGGETYCRFNDLQAYPAPHHVQPINTAEFNSNCLRIPAFNATIVRGILSVDGCPNAQYNLGNQQDWQAYKAPVVVEKGKSVRVRCDDSDSILLVSPPILEERGNASLLSDKPSVFVVMVDAISYEALHRLMPKTVQMLKNEGELDVFDFTKFSTVGLNSNPNKFALFGRHHYSNALKYHANSNLSWIWEHAKDLGYTTIIAEDECPRHDSVWDLMNVPTYGNKLNPETGPDFVLLSQLCVPDPHPNKYCVKGRWGFEYLVDYITNMINDFEEYGSEKPIFMWSNFIDAHEPTQWAAALMDTLVVNYLHTIMHSRFMDNGIIVFLSDHGLHFGDFAYSSILGSAENKHPFLYVISKKGTLNHGILHANQDKLITPFDLYRSLSSSIGYDGIQDARDMNIFSEYVPYDRTCDMAGIPATYCMCSYGPESCSLDVPANLWHTCVALYAHPRFFNWEYYSAEELSPRFGRDFTECESIKHWCAFGLSQGWNGTDCSNLRDYVARTPALASSEFCWAWPTDCNWGHVVNYYFTEGFLRDL